MGIGKRLKEAREKAGLTQEELGRRVGVTGSAITNYEKETSHPKEPVLYALINVLNVEPNFLFQDCVNVLKNSKKDVYSEEERERIKKYRSLDPYGKEAVDGVLEVEHKRCQEAQVRAAVRAKPEQMPPEAAAEIAPEAFTYIIPGYLSPMSAGTGQEAGSEYPDDFGLVKRPPRGTSFIARVSGDSMEPTYYDGDLVFVHSANEIRVGQTGTFFMDGQQWIKELGDGELISHNHAYPPRKMTPDIRCQGLVLGVCDESYFGK